MDCLFCKIANKELKSAIVYEDPQVVAFEDVNPQAPTHLLIIPRKHIATVNDLEPQDNALIGHMTQIAKRLAVEKQCAADGYRIVLNCNAGAGQSVFHIHMHLLGGRQMMWPPG